MYFPVLFSLLFFFNATATTEIYTLSLHDALPISPSGRRGWRRRSPPAARTRAAPAPARPARSARRSPPRTPCAPGGTRSEEHTSELQSQFHLVCRLLLEKKKKKKYKTKT